MLTFRIFNDAILINMTKISDSAQLLRFSKRDIDIQKIEAKYQGFFRLDEYQVSHKKFDGSTSAVLSREVFERGDAVVLILFDPVLDNVVFIEQFRPGAIRQNDTPWMLEFVAGMFEAGEDPIDVAIREAQEEANLVVKPENIEFVMKYLSSPGGMSEAIYLYAAIIHSEHCGGIYGLPEENEDILVHVVPRLDAMKLLADGKITNAATVIGLQWLALNVERLKHLPR